MASSQPGVWNWSKPNLSSWAQTYPTLILITTEHQIILLQKNNLQCFPLVGFRRLLLKSLCFQQDRNSEFCPACCRKSLLQPPEPAGPPASVPPAGDARLPRTRGAARRSQRKPASEIPPPTGLGPQVLSLKEAMFSKMI